MTDLFEDALAAADDVIHRTFDNVDISVDGQKTFRGIFDDSFEISSIEGGGEISTYDATLNVKASVGACLVKRTFVTLTFSDGRFEYYRVIHSYPSKDGEMTVTLSVDSLDDEEQSKPDIRY